MTRRKLFGVLAAPIVAKYVPKKSFTGWVPDYKCYVFGTSYITKDIYKEIIEEASNRLAWQASLTVDTITRNILEAK